MAVQLAEQVGSRWRTRSVVLDHVTVRPSDIWGNSVGPRSLAGSLWIHGNHQDHHALARSIEPYPPLFFVIVSLCAPLLWHTILSFVIDVPTLVLAHNPVLITKFNPSVFSTLGHACSTCTLVTSLFGNQCCKYSCLPALLLHRVLGLRRSSPERIFGNDQRAWRRWMLNADERCQYFWLGEVIWCSVCCHGDGKVLFVLVLQINPPSSSCVLMMWLSFDTTWHIFMSCCFCWSARQGTHCLGLFGFAWAV